MPKTKAMIEKEKRETEKQLKSARVSAIEVVGDNVALPPKKRRIKRLGKYAIEFHKENEE